jgi:hypothetical protein
MDLPRLLTDFQVRFGDKSAELTHFLGVYYADWEHFKQLVINIAEKLGKFEDPELLPECMSILMKHEFKPRFWDAESFVLFLNYLDPELTKMFFCIIHKVITHPHFGPYCVHVRQNFRMKLGYTHIYSDVIEYTGFEFYDALVEINAHFLKFIPVHCPMQFFLSRLHLCDLDVARFRESSLAQRQKMLVISGLSGLLVRRLFLKDTRLSSQMKTIIIRNF